MCHNLCMHGRFMHRCLDLARKGQCETGINPLVGAVLVRDGKVIAEGFRSGFGKAHAERALLEKIEPRTSPALSAENAGRYRAPQKIRSTDILYVNLDPCCHTHKKTPPCVPLIIKSGIRRVVFGMYDPNPEVSGKGVEMLRKAGVEVTGPINPVECERLNRGFISVMTKGRPWITLKNARTIDGRYSDPKGGRMLITDETQDRWAHEFLRARHDAILVGVATILADDPRLDVRYVNNPPENYRIILDASLRIPTDSKVLQMLLKGRTIIVTSPDADLKKAEKLAESGVRIIPVEYKNGRFDWLSLWGKLTTPDGEFHGISTILLEGGPKTWEIFRNEKMVDEEVIFIGE